MLLINFVNFSFKHFTYSLKFDLINSKYSAVSALSLRFYLTKVEEDWTCNFKTTLDVNVIATLCMYSYLLKI